MRELGRQTKVSHALISKILSDKIELTADTCIRVSLALDHDPVRILKMAELLPLDVTQDNEPEAYELLSLFRKLDEDKRRQAIDYLRFLNQR